MRPLKSARSVARMRLIGVFVTVVAAGAAAATAAPTALAADAVFGGTSNTGDPIVVRTDADAKELRSLGVSWRAPCADGQGFARSGTLTPAEPVAGFSPAPTELLMARNAKGAFKGTQLAASDLGDNAAAITVEISGKLTSKRATGTLHAQVTVLEKATGATLTTCEQRMRFSATRAPSVIYGGETSQGEPIVLRLDARRSRVNEVRVTWRADCAPSGAFLRVADRFVNFALKRSGRFGNPFSAHLPRDGGGVSNLRYRLTGRVTETKASGVLQAQMSDLDATGVATDSCDAGNLTWKAATG